MPANFTIPLVTVIPGQTITSSGWNGEFENIDTNFTPSGMDDYSTTDSEMQTTADPYPASAVSRPTSLAGEIQRIRYVLAQLSGETYWYIDPDSNIASLYAKFPIQTADIGDSQVTTAKIADSNITTAKIANSNVTTAKIADSNVTTDKVAAQAITADKIVTSIDLNGQIRTSTSTCFFAHATADQDNVTGDGTVYQVHFETEYFDQTGCYNPSTHTFTAQVGGQYLFNVQVQVTGGAAGNKNELYLITDNNTFVCEDWPTSTITQSINVITTMGAGHTAVVKVKGTGGAKIESVKANSSTLGTGWATFFSGNLIA